MQTKIFDTKKKQFVYYFKIHGFINSVKKKKEEWRMLPHRSRERAKNSSDSPFTSLAVAEESMVLAKERERSKFHRARGETRAMLCSYFDVKKSSLTLPQII